MNPLKIVKAVPMALLVVAALLSSSTLAMAQAGNLDLTFGRGGIVTTPNTSTASALAIQSDGKIVVVGQATDAHGAPELALARYKTDGSLDATFGTGGIVAFPLNNGGLPIGVAIQQDGKIVTAAPTDLSMFVFRFNTDGTLDQDFREVPLGFAIGDTPGGIAVQSDGKILVATDVLTRLLSSGELDSSFGTGGVAPLVSSAEALSLLSSGKMLVKGFPFHSGGAAQYNADGSLDLSFGVAGQTPNLGITSAITPLSDGKFVIAGALTSGPSPGGVKPQGFVVVRYDSDGTIDATFGTRGAAITNFTGDSFSGALAVAEQSDGALVAAGFTAAQNCLCGGQASDFALARYTAEGQLDTTFGTNGLVITSFNGDSASIIALAIQSDGKIVALGRDRPLSSGSPNPGFTFARYLGE